MLGVGIARDNPYWFPVRDRAPRFIPYGRASERGRLLTDYLLGAVPR